MINDYEGKILVRAFCDELEKLSAWAGTPTATAGNALEVSANPAPPAKSFAIKAAPPKTGKQTWFKADTQQTAKSKSGGGTPQKVTV